MSRIRANQITNQAADGAPTVQHGLIIAGVSTLTGVDVDDFVSVGSNIHLGNAGVATATTFVGNLTGNVTGTASGNAVLTGSTNDQLVTVTGANAITGESALTYSGNILKNEVSDASGLTAHILVNNSESSAGVSLLGSGSSFSSGGWAPVTDAAHIRSSAGAANGLVLQASAGNMIFYVGGSPTERLRITSAGHVGIGTESPTEKFNVFGTNVKPVIGHKTDHTVHYSSYDTQNNTTLEISSSGTGTNVSGLALNNPTTSANTSYKTITFCCSGTSSVEKRGAIISSNHDEDSSSTVKGNLSMYVNNGSGLQTALFINHDAHVTKPNNPSFHVGSPNVSGNGAGEVWSGQGAIFSNIGSHYNNSNGRFTAPVAGQYFFFHWGMSASQNQTCDVYSRKNGGRDQIGTSFNQPSGQAHDQFGCSYVRTLAAGDYVDVYTSSGNVYSASDGRHGGWGGWLIG